MAFYEIEVMATKHIIIEAKSMEEAEQGACDAAFPDYSEPFSSCEIPNKQAMANKDLVDLFISLI